MLDAAFLPETYDSTRSLIRQIPLEDQEQEAYAGLDSTDTLDKAFEPTGALARFVRDEENERESRMPGFLGDFAHRVFLPGWVIIAWTLLTGG